MAKQNRMPAIRFRGFVDPWEQRKLGEIGSVSMCRRIFKEQTSQTGDIPFYKIGTFGAEPDAFISRELFEEYKSKYPYPKKGDILISASGSIGRTVEFAGNNEYFQDSNIVWLSHDERLSNPFLKCFYSVVKWAGIEGSTIKRLYNDNILNTVICMPSVPEQERIGAFFENLDHLITLHQRKYDKLVAIKKSMLEKMFPREGSRFPEIRFAGFAEPWERRKLGECFSERVEGMPNGELISVTINDGIKKFSELGRHDNSNDDKSKYKKVCVGDIAYNSMRMWQGASGYSPYEGIVSPAYTVLSPNDGVFSKCVAYQFKLPQMIHTFQINSQGITSDNWNLKYPALSEIKIYISGNLEEQKKIAGFFTKLDNLITLHQRKLEKLQAIKKSMLEKMFA